MRSFVKKLLLLTGAVLVMAAPNQVPGQASPPATPSAGAARPNPWADQRLLNWSQQINAGQYDQVLQQVETDLVSPSPHPFSVDIWCRLQLRQRKLDSAAAAITDPALKQALGIAPELYSLDFDGKVSQALRLVKSVPPSEIHGTLTWMMILGWADTATDFNQGFDWASHVVRTEEPNFIIVWEIFNQAENDKRVKARLQSLLDQDKAFAASNAGQALQGAVGPGCHRFCRSERARQSCRHGPAVCGNCQSLAPGLPRRRQCAFVRGLASGLRQR
jgi:hypothetical protein